MLKAGIRRCYPWPAGGPPSDAPDLQGTALDITAFIDSIQAFDLLLVAFLFGMFVLGYVQGVIRRLIGILTITFSFVLAANLREPMGEFLARNWTQFPAEYSRMIGFGVMFATFAVATALITQVTYKEARLWPRAELLEDTLAGVLGVIQGLLILLAVVTIIHPYFVSHGAPATNELPVLRNFHDLLAGSAAESLYINVLIPGFNMVLDPFMPDQIKSAFPFPKAS